MPTSGFNKQTEQSDEWETPQWLFDALNAEFGFTFDAAANASNTKCKEFYSGDQDDDLPWRGRVFCNPPYSQIDTFVGRALEHNGLTVMLLPSRTDTDWFCRLVESPRVELRFFRKRVQFCLDGKPTGSPRFGTVVAIVNPRH